MSSAFVNLAVGGTLVVAGTTTLSGALTSASSINSQELITNKLTTTGNISCASLSVSGNISSAKLNVAGNIYCNYLESATDVSASSLFITTNSIISQNSTVNGDTSLHGDLQMDASKQIFFRNGLFDYIKYDSSIGGIGISSTTAGRIGTNAKTDVITYNTSSISLNGNLAITKNTQFVNNLPSTLIVPTAYFELTNKQYVDTQTGFLSGNVAILQTQTGLIASNITTLQAQDGFIAGNITTLQTKTTNQSFASGTTSFSGTTSLGLTTLNDNALFMRGATDTNHSLQYNASVNGPLLKGFNGGLLGTINKNDILTWNSTGAFHSITIAGNTNCVGNILLGGTTSVLALNDKPLYLRFGDDSFHSLQYNATSDGPALKGTAGGRIGTVAKTDILTWNTSGAVHSVSVSGNTNITGNTNIIGNTNITGVIKELSSGSSINFYRKTNCGTNETFDFQAIHGLYTVCYNLNHDRSTTAFYYVDVLNNVNGGSYVTIVNQGSGMSASINTSTNVFTINSPFINGILLINRIMSYS